MLTLETPETMGAPPQPIVLEWQQRLSRSILWDIQRQYFARAGVSAWRHGTVPDYVTTSPYLADAYAKVVLGFVRDCHARAAAEGAGSGWLDPSEPIHIIELGSGPGRLAFHLLRRLRPLLESAFPEIRVKLVMTDVSEPLIRFWQSHEPLAPLVRAGLLDFARFDVEAPAPLELVVSGETLRPGSTRNPVIVIANYLFDSIRQDCFFVRKGALFEGALTISSPREGIRPDDPGVLEHLALRWDAVPVAGDYYGDPALDDILECYRQTLLDTAVPFPIVGIRCLDYLASLSRGRLLAVSADKGFSRASDLLHLGEPVAIQVHGSISMMVNYHAMAEYVVAKGGQALVSEHAHSHIEVVAFALGMAAEHGRETRRAFDDAIGERGPDDFYNESRALRASSDGCTLPQLLSHMRLALWDSHVFLELLTPLCRHAGSALEPWRSELRRAMERVWDAYYPLGEDTDVAFAIAAVLHAAGFFRDALRYLERSRLAYGDRPMTLYNMATCHYRLDELDEAARCIDQALALDGSLTNARAMRLVLDAGRGRRMVRGMTP